MTIFSSELRGLMPPDNLDALDQDDAERGLLVVLRGETPTEWPTLEPTR